MAEQTRKGTLYIVATPIGNLEDITLRALRILREVDCIAAEDTRHSLKLLSHYGISKPMVSYWSEREKARSEAIISKLSEGLSVALISDAGTPGISDPGSVLIRKALDIGLPVISVPGPSAAIAALSASGLPTESFTFLGFLSARQGARMKELKALVPEQRTLVFYEAPHRILETLTDMAAAFGDRHAAVAREITKLHEEFFRGALSAVIRQIETSTIAGEYVIIVGGNQAGGASFEEAMAEMRGLMRKGLGRKEAAATVAGRYGLSKKELYDKSLNS